MRSNMRQTSILAACAGALLLLSSCVQWHIGERIREAGAIHTGVDILHPVDGKQHRAAGKGAYDEAVVRAPEVSYHLRSPLISPFSDTDGDKRRACCVRPTGREHLALVDCEAATSIASMPNDNAPEKFRSLVTELPRGSKASPVRAVDELHAYKLSDRRSYGSLSVTKPSWARRHHLAAVTAPLSPP